MNSDYDKNLETQIDRELKSLPNFKAPEGLAAGVMMQIRAREDRTFYTRSWESWPVGARVLSFAVLTGVFAVICVLGWNVFFSQALATVLHEAGRALSCFTAIFETCRVLLQAAALVVSKLGTGFIIACVMVAAFSYFLCIGAGTAFFRYAFSRR